MPYPSEQQDRFIVRMPDGMRDRLAELAKASGRSMNAEVVQRLQRTFDEDAQRDANRAALRQSLGSTHEDSLRAIACVNTPGTPEGDAHARLQQWLEIGRAWAFQAFQAAELMQQGKSGLGAIQPPQGIERG